VPFNRLILWAVLPCVSPMVVRLISVSEDAELIDLNDIFQQILVRLSGLGYHVPQLLVRSSHALRAVGAINAFATHPK
jgi:hypothetical protein